MQNERLDVPVTVKFGSPEQQKILRTARDLSDFLLNSWPGKRSPKHRAALQACHAVIDSGKPAMTARLRALRLQKEEADQAERDAAPPAVKKPARKKKAPAS